MTYPILRFLLRHFPKDHPASEVLDLIETHHQHLKHTQPHKANTFLVLAHMDAAKTALEWNLEEAMKTPTQTRLIFPLMLCLTICLSAAIPLVPMPIQITINPILGFDALPAPKSVQEATQKLADGVTASGHTTQITQETHRFPFPSPQTLVVSFYGLPDLPTPALNTHYPTREALEKDTQRHQQDIQKRNQNTLNFLDTEGQKILRRPDTPMPGFVCFASKGQDVLVQNQPYRVFNLQWTVDSPQHNGGYKTFFRTVMRARDQSPPDSWEAGCPS